MITNTLRATVNVILTLIIALLGVRFVLKLFAANPNNVFVSWTYDISSGLVAPFTNIFAPLTIQNNYVIEFSVLIAMLVYALIGLIVYAVIDFLGSATDEEQRRTDAVRHTN